MKLKKYSKTVFTAALLLALNINTAQAESVGAYERSLASDTSYLHSVQPALGFNQGQFVLSVDYEHRVTEHFGFGGSFYYTPDDSSSGYAEIVGIHAQSKIHAPLGDIDFYARPGFGLAKLEYKTSAGKDEDSTVLSPLFGLGVVYRIADNVGIGVEYLTLFNWTDDDYAGSKSDFLISSQIRF
jgi:opacity protein-like surface antigen